MQQHDLIPHLFRTEFRKIVAVLCRRFGAEQLSIAEDIASDTFLAAAENWPYKGLPPDPTAWLYTVAKNKARNYLQRTAHFRSKIAPRLRQESTADDQLEIDLSEQNIADSQLQMLFAICHPAIPPGSQIGLALRVLCGFGIEEIANAFLTSKETINKRLQRAKGKLRSEQIRIGLPPPEEIDSRLQSVLATLYLLFNEGYYSESRNEVLREDLCLEAMRLTHLLAENAGTNLPPVNALLALMCFHASRFRARKGMNERMILYHDQDTSLWNRELVAKGACYLHRAATGNQLSTYHLEASIAYWHTTGEDSKEKWENILLLYDQLLEISCSPPAALNRAYALSKVRGKMTAIAEAEKLSLDDNPFYHSLLGELYTGLDIEKAKDHLARAAVLASSRHEREVIAMKLAALNS